ncbi:hypothetical protein PRIPAC_81072 [Pristionchus pacificus]|uniref:Uncharacterized protein n=1 Tax=Pristionchus pacificus TaxID=54126 RepID=A0A2A6BWV2_PRIPA|nr:hypothetical protein PRIPAC_81072 [Pristionchus pacificus]|eukprot:PDM70337.1 hypothetical protein PRIPAC_46583 [Pristionchus pacificus]
MEVEEAIGSRDTPQAKGDRFQQLFVVRDFPSRLLKLCYLDIISTVKVFLSMIGHELPGYPANKVEAMAVQNATGSLEIMGQLVLNEWELLRHKIREFGAKIRQMSSKVAAATVKRLWHQLLSLLRRHSDSIPRQFELDAALILNEMEREREEKPPPRDTLADIRRVLLEDPDDEGIILRKRQAAWRAMPPPRANADGSPVREGDTSAYQLFNRPMASLRDDDDFDRLSGPSTHFAQSESEKILSLEAQLALLTRQLGMVMAAGGIQQQYAGSGAGSQRPSRSVSRSHSRASLYGGGGGGQPMGGAYHHHLPSLRHSSSQQHSPSPTSDDDGVYMQDADSASSYASPSHTTIPLQHLQQQQQVTVAGRRESMIMTGDATSLTTSIPPAPPLPPPPFVLQQLQRMGSSHEMASSPSSSTLIPLASSSFNDDAGGDSNGRHSSSDGRLSPSLSSPPCSPLPPPPPQLQQLQQKKRVQQRSGVEQEVRAGEMGLAYFPSPIAGAAEAQKLKSQSSSSSRSFLDDISRGNFALRKTSSEKSPTGSLLSSTSGEETEHDENVRNTSSGPLVKPTTQQLLSRKVSLKRISTDRSPGGTPQNRNRRRAPSLGQDGGRGLHTGDYLAAALARQFNTIRVNEEDDDQSVIDQSWDE